MILSGGRADGQQQNETNCPPLGPVRSPEAFALRAHQTDAGCDQILPE